jgi:hypothetical protein
MSVLVYSFSSGCGIRTENTDAKSTPKATTENIDPREVPIGNHGSTHESQIQGIEASHQDEIELTISEEGVQTRDRICIKATVRNNSNQTIGWDREFSVYEIELTISEEGVQTRDRICIKATVRNNSNQTIGGDREFSVFENWELVPDNGADVLDPKVIVDRIEQTKEYLAKARFVKIDPGKAFSRTIELTKSFREFRVDAWGSPPKSRHPHFEGYESMERYTLGPMVKKVRLRIHYSSRGPEWLAFRAMFGFDPDDVHLVKIGRHESNEIVLAFD